MAELGVSVLSAAATTMASAALLMQAQVTFFSLFGTFILLNIGLSALWAFIFFVALLLLVGPENDSGDLRKYFRQLKKKM